MACKVNSLQITSNASQCKDKNHEQTDGYKGSGSLQPEYAEDPLFDIVVACCARGSRIKTKRRKHKRASQTEDE